MSNAVTVTHLGPCHDFHTATLLISFTPLEELDQTEQRTQRVGGEVTRGANSEGEIQGHEEQHRGREEAAGPHSRETPEGSECARVCSTTTRLPPNPHQILC